MVDDAVTNGAGARWPRLERAWARRGRVDYALVIISTAEYRALMDWETSKGGPPLTGMPMYATANPMLREAMVVWPHPDKDIEVFAE